jgi:TPR repeat protein
VNQPRGSSVLSDEATSEDDLGRDLFVTALKNVLETAASPLVVALYGTWGAGKTSMMLRLREKLEPSGGRFRRSAATVWFDPWEHSKDDNPAVSLLYAIRKDLSLEKDLTVQRALLAIARVVGTEIRVPYLGFSLGRVASTYSQLAREDVERRSEQTLLRSRFEDVITAARSKNPGIPLVVFIDDLDRCLPGVAVGLLEAIKLFLNLPGCIFILGVDREQLEAAIAAEYGRLGISRESYLDKIVQLPFTIPALAKKGVQEYIVKHLPEQLQDCQAMLAAAAPDNPRRLKRTINSLFLLDRIAIESRLPHYNNKFMCAIALIQIAAPDLYQRLRQSPVDWQHVVALGSDTTSPTWLTGMLNGTDARLGLQAALTGLADEPEAISTDITAYLTLTEQIADSSLEQQKSIEISSADEPRHQMTNGLPDDGQGGVHADAGLQSSVASRLEGSAALLERQGNLDEALHWYQRAAQSGDPPAMRGLAALLERQGNLDEALHWYQRAAQSGDPPAMRGLAALVERQGNLDEALHWYQRAAEEGDIRAMGGLAVLLERQGNLDEAVLLYRRAAESGDILAMKSLAALLDRQGGREEAKIWYQRAEETDNLQS